MEENKVPKPGEENPEFEVVPESEDLPPEVELTQNEVKEDPQKQASQSGDEEGDIPDDEKDGFDPNIKQMMTGIRVSQVNKRDFEVDRTYSNLTEEEKENYDIIGKF
jgi:hypothetical protein